MRSTCVERGVQQWIHLRQTDKVSSLLKMETLRNEKGSVEQKTGIRHREGVAECSNSSNKDRLMTSQTCLSLRNQGHVEGVVKPA